MYSINYSNLYMDDFAEALIYIKDVLKNEDASNNLKNKTNEEIQKLKSFPHTGTRLYKDNIETKYRYIRVNNYYVFYYVKNDKVYIDRFIYAKRDFIKVLNL